MDFCLSWAVQLLKSVKVCHGLLFGLLCSTIKFCKVKSGLLFDFILDKGVNIFGTLVLFALIKKQ